MRRMNISELSELMAFSLRVTAAEIDITDIELKTPEAILQEIKNLQPDVYNLLQEDFNIYLEYYLTCSQE
jgi:hypothetical protein